MRVEPRFVPPLMPSGMGGVSVFQEVFGLTRLGETLRAYQDKEFRSVLDQELEEGAQKKAQEAADAHKAAFDFVKE